MSEATRCTEPGGLVGPTQRPSFRPLSGRRQTPRVRGGLASLRRPELLLLCLALWACDGTSPADAGPAEECASSVDCADGVFCNGQERCEAGRCVAGDAPCEATQACDERLEACAAPCEVTPDADGDGHDSLACGGDDCDDEDPERHPGRAEVCGEDPTHDEDCDPSTFGDRDADGDGYVDAACCNESACGQDCDDAEPGVHPAEAEACGDGLDNDCDGAVDEGAEGVPWWRDADGDGWGGVEAETTSSCARPGDGWASRSGDCDDARAEVHPGAREVVGDGLDNDCDGSADETYELRGGIEGLGAVRARYPYRLSRQRVEGVATSCASGGRPCVTGGIVSGEPPWGGDP